MNDVYDFGRDPDPLVNLARGPGDLKRRLRTLLRWLCDPPPPGCDRLA